MRKHFKIYPGWDDEFSITPDDLLNKISFVFTMRGFEGLYFKLKEPLKMDMNCFKFAFDRDNGIYINDGDMRFNDFMGNQIVDSGADPISFIRAYLIEQNLSHLIL